MSKIKPANESSSKTVTTLNQNDPLYVTALARGLSILKCCGEAAHDLSVSEIAKLLDLPQSTVWRACYTLEQHGYLVRVENDRLRPGLSAAYRFGGKLSGSCCDWWSAFLITRLCSFSMPEARARSIASRRQCPGSAQCCQ